MSHKCIFCGEEILPEESWIGKKDYVYNFQCDNPFCQAEYDSRGKQIPDITVRVTPIMSGSELDFDVL